MKALMSLTSAAAALLHLSGQPGAVLDDNANSIVKRVDSPQRGEDGSCTIFQEEIADPDNADETIWVPTLQDVSRSQCMTVCGDAIAEKINDGDVGSATCIAIGEVPWETESSDGVEVAQANCTCNNPLIDALATGFVEALPAVGELGCDLFMTAFNLVIDLGSLAIPGVGQAISGGMIAGIQAAKLAAYTYDAGSIGASAFSSWASDGMCGTSHLPDDVKKVFDVWNAVTPAVLPKGSFFNGAIPKWPKGSGRAGDRGAPDATRDDKPEPSTEQSPPSTDKSDEQTSTTGDPSETSTGGQQTDGPEKCKRGDSKGKQPDKGCDDNNVHITSIVRSVEGDRTTITKSCSAKDHTQACAHYYSAVKDQGYKGIFTCADDKKREDATFTKDWTRQHKGKGWGAYTQPTYKFKGDGDDREVRCQADEWPPGYFLPSDKAEREKSEWSQLVRRLPGEENGGAASLSTNFCLENDGGKGNGQRVNVMRKGNTHLKGKPEEQVPLNQELLDLGQSRVNSETHDDKTTFTTIDEVKYTRAVFELGFDYADDDKPTAENDWFLFDNPCFPKDIVPKDPGFALLTDDRWYATHNFGDDWDVAQTKALYASDPADDLVGEAEERRNEAINDKRQIDSSERLEHIDNALVLRDDNLNISRRLTDEEIRRRVQIIHCADHSCSAERKRLHGEEGFLLIPGAHEPSVPAANVATETAATTLSTSFVSIERPSAAYEHPRATGPAAS